MDKKHLASLILIQLEGLSQVDADNSVDNSLILLNETLRNAQELAREVLEDSEENIKAA